ncbi:MAG: bifunctional phosphopantothenoylcysteine decarboxylase/phosphopantothenate--cysteine ligase CoaBC [Firmicutes bacterium]|nr:bifunctional phosphopantothenoylcysteine decarboxylase/phosphopantothenate--cysteine ligase CoaBC [Bacillota bacterium]
MDGLKGKNVLVGVTGGIAAYKVVDVISQLKKRGAEVFVIMTKEAQEFIKPLTFQTISQNLVITEMFSTPRTWEVEHISLAEKADVFLIAPATANIIGKIANGIADDMLTTTVIATKSKVVFAPSMNVNMFENPITQRNLDILRKAGYYIIDPEEGLLACGDSGKGRLPSTDTIIDELEYVLTKKDFKGKKILVTAGPTQEAIDPVRFITNYSSGKMGYAIAKAGSNRGGEVVLITGPTYLQPPRRVKVVKVKSAVEMKEAVFKEFQEAEIIIKAAAVADYRPACIADQKIKKDDSNLKIELVRNPDILAELGRQKGNRILVGFAAETQDIIKNARDKLVKKGLDMIIANDLTAEGSGFGTDTNIVQIITANGEIKKYEKMGKIELAHIILDKIFCLLS